MALRAKNPEAVQKRLKMLLYGPAGVGKTTAAIQLPKPYLIDTEKGATNAQYLKLLTKAGGAYFGSSDFDEVLQEVTSLLTEKHEYRTVVIDPLTVIYNELLDRSAQELASTTDPAGTAFGRHKGPADRKVKRLLNTLVRLDMNVVITCHAKTKWERNGKEVVDAGQTFDGYTKLDYLFDLVLELHARGDKRMATVTKTRIEEFPLGSSFEFSYAELAQRYGKDILEKASVAVALANQEQVVRLTNLIETLKVEPAKVARWMSKEGVEEFSEMSADVIGKYIVAAEKQLRSAMAGA